ncbi:MAG: hypothetical protein RLZZ253_2327 [Verrucomicrobiota bacterium]|jgi:AraC-like DNA-binding protein
MAKSESSRVEPGADIRPEGTETLAVRGRATEVRAWLAGSPVVEALEAAGIAHAGVLTTTHPYRIVRDQLAGAYFMATLSGCGRVYLNGTWAECGKGEAVLLMPGVLNAFAAVDGAPWSHCWVRLVRGAEVFGGRLDRMQAVTPWKAGALSHAVLGLREAALEGGSPAVLHHWVELVVRSVREFGRSYAPDPRLARLWACVEEDVGGDWTVERMAGIAALSPEQLRRLSRAATGRSLHGQLMHLRMRRAAELLLEGELPIKGIAEAVGYANPFAFSAAFKQVMGWPPSTYAARQRGS